MGNGISTQNMTLQQRLLAAWHKYFHHTDKAEQISKKHRLDKSTNPAMKSTYLQAQKEHIQKADEALTEATNVQNKLTAEQGDENAQKVVDATFKEAQKASENGATTGDTTGDATGGGSVPESSGDALPALQFM